MKKIFCIGNLWLLASCFSLISCFMFVWMCTNDFNVNCRQHLLKAASTSNVEVAQEEVGQAVSYAQKHNMTEGIGLWYNNLCQESQELSKASTKANISISTACPAFIEVYPYRWFILGWMLVSMIDIICAVVWDVESSLDFKMASPISC